MVGHLAWAGVTVALCHTQLSTTSATCTPTAWSSPSTWAVISSHEAAASHRRTTRSPAHLHGAGVGPPRGLVEGWDSNWGEAGEGLGTSWTGQGNSLWEGHVDTTLPPPCRFTVASRAL